MWVNVPTVQAMDAPTVMSRFLKLGAANIGCEAKSSQF
jgi:hypothetical protein